MLSGRDRQGVLALWLLMVPAQQACTGGVCLAAPLRATGGPRLQAPLRLRGGGRQDDPDWMESLERTMENRGPNSITSECVFDNPRAPGRRRCASRHTETGTAAGLARHRTTEHREQDAAAASALLVEAASD
jgi:hypothetical protein